ncbi:MAG: peptidylprolyl isomerase [Thermoplasmatales archaeon]|nr:MAG: peptidylprolyl isomerase [Thermoplasmatales archaeon]
MTSKKSQRKRANPLKKRSAFESKGVRIGIVIIFIVIIAVAAVYLYDGSSDEGNGVVGNEVVGNPIAIIDTSMGTIKVELYKDKVPNTCENFIKLANDGFYENLVFHRVIDDFMIQGGGFSTDGPPAKDSPYGTIDLEIHPDVRHVDGAIAMARTDDPNSATSQFYICDGSQSFLDDNYAAFGKVIEGMAVVRGIASVNTTSKYGMQDWPVDDVIINNIIIENQ